MWGCEGVYKVAEGVYGGGMWGQGGVCMGLFGAVWGCMGLIGVIGVRDVHLPSNHVITARSANQGELHKSF